MKKFISLFLLVALCFMAFAGCSNQTAPNTTTPDSGTAKPSDAGTASPGTTTTDGAGTQVRESIIRMTSDATPVIDPHIHTGYAASIAHTNIYDTLIFPRGDDVEPMLAESWEESDDGLEYTFKLKQGVLFHDGTTEMKAKDVVFSTKRMLTIGEGFAYLYSKVIKDVQVVDDYTVKFILNNRFGPFVSSLCRLYIMSEDIIMANLADGPYGEFGDYGRDWLITNDAGTGPYKTVELIQQDYYLGEKFEQWHMGWETRPNAPKQWKLINGTEPTTVRTMMSTQELEISDMWQSNENYVAMDALDGVSLVSFSCRLIQNMYFNTTVAPMDDLNYRKAVACLFDMKLIAEDIFHSNVCTSPVSGRTAGHVNVVNYELNYDKAREYLAKSKYADTYQDMPIELLFSIEGNELEKVALAVQAACKEVGIPVNVSKAPWVTVQERVTSPDTTPHMFTVNAGPQYNEAGATLESQFHSKTQGTYENGAWLGTLLDAEIEDALATSDRTERFQKYEVLQKKIAEEICPGVWMADLLMRVVYQDTYIEWYVTEASETDAYMMGYQFYMPDIKIYTDR